MIKINNLTKDYKPKKGVPVRALDNVNLQIDSTGMVFLLGKSGSGKSTLLNVLGGLDAPTNGEFVVGNKSSANFKQRDYDAYRNTYIGFIFQEYNILEEFSVGVNIGLALELQGRKATSEAINAILSEIDLEGYGNRNPNELSGGQKQRVAIARALIKDPRVIMADEPTGALDSKTGKEVFETLRKLSRDKLVIVVSHDRENAELYADRIIELADGRVIADDIIDNSQVAAATKQSDKYVAGYVLTAQDAQIIQDYISGVRPPEVAEVEYTKTAIATPTASTAKPLGKRAYSDMDGKMTPSKLPISKAIKMGSAPLKAKPIRLAFTILLCLVSFTLFGLVDAMAVFNYTNAYTSAIELGGYDVGLYTMQTEQEDEWSEFKWFTDTKMTQAEADDVVSEVGGVPIISYNSNVNVSFSSETIYKTANNYVASLTSAQMEQFGYSVVGSMPTSSGEVMLSCYFYEIVSQYGMEMIVDQGNNNYVGQTLKASDITSETQFLALKPTIYVNDKAVTIVGLFDTGFQDNAKYDELYDCSMNEIWNDDDMRILYQSYENAYLYSMTSCLIVYEDDLASYASGQYECWENQLMNYSSLGSDNVVYLEGTLDAGEVLVTNEYFINNGIHLDFNFILDTFDCNGYGDVSVMSSEVDCQDQVFSSYVDAFHTLYQHYIINNIGSDELEDMYRQITYYTDSDNYKENAADKFNNSIYPTTAVTADNIIDLQIMYLLYREYTYDVSAYIDNNFGDDFAQMLSDMTNPIYKTAIENLTVSVKYYDMNTGTEYSQKYTVVGVSNYGDSFTLVMPDGYVYSGDSVEARIYDHVMFLLPDDTAELSKLIDNTNIEVDGVQYYINSPAYADVRMAVSMISMLTDVLFYVALGFAVFAMLMMYNFISVSVAYKRSEIGILRAIGSNSRDVFKIFLCEAMIIAVINAVLASIATVAGGLIINSALVSSMGLVFNLLTISIRQVALIFAISIVTAYVSSLLPVSKIARKRPIDAIRGK